METRRIRRQERRRMYRTGLLGCSVAVLGVALGMMLPHNRIVFFALLGVAAICVVIVIARDETHAPLHGLHRVVRLPLRRSVATTGASLRSRAAGSARAVLGSRRTPAPIVLDEPDDEAAAWWGPYVVPAEPFVSGSAGTYASLAIPEPEVVGPPEPVLAAPIATAHVPADPSVTVKVRIGQVWATTRRHVEPITRKVKRSSEETPASAST
jgi:hypothetical protein